MYLKKIIISLASLTIFSCESIDENTSPSNSQIKTGQIKSSAAGKPVVYQMFTRLFGNKKTLNKTWGTINENGVGKFSDITDEALKGIKEFGVTHLWYTGVLHHAVINDYSAYGISNDDPDVVKGRAGSPYAVKDYYSVNPDLAVDPAKRLEEFKALIKRTHNQNMKVIIDIIPNHVARNYQSLGKPKGAKDFGEDDDVRHEYKRDNNFYYIVGEDFQVPEWQKGYKPLAGEDHPLADGKFVESPAKWTGNGSRMAQPDFYDWYETVKINYGVKPDGSYDFARLPEEYRSKSHQAHYLFWKEKSVPNSWKKFRDIVLFWTDIGVDGFRYDMAEMVPVEFWSYLNSSIKNANPDAFLLAEVYNPKLYRDYIQLGKMDYLYDKVDFYDTLKRIMQGKENISTLVAANKKFLDIDSHMLHFLENHDEQRIASQDFAGDAKVGMPAMVVSTLIGKGPTMLYIAQALGEAAEQDAGFGHATRTSIFDYWAIPSLQRWVNGGKFDGGLLTVEEKKLRAFYQRLLSISASSAALNSNYYDLHQYNLETRSLYGEKLISFARWDSVEKLLIISNFSKTENYDVTLHLPQELLSLWDLKDGNYNFYDLLANQTNLVSSESFDSFNVELIVKDNQGKMRLILQPLASKVLKLKRQIN